MLQYLPFHIIQYLPLHVCQSYIHYNLQYSEQFVEIHLHLVYFTHHYLAVFLVVLVESPSDQELEELDRFLVLNLSKTVESLVYHLVELTFPVLELFQQELRVHV